jgi:hypothetical protein
VNPLHHIQKQLDVVERTMLEVIERGPHFRVVRLVKRGPLCPLMIGWVQTLFEPGQPDNTMERSRHVAGYLSGESVPHEELARLFASGKAGSRHITQAEYAGMVAEIASNRRAGRFDPRSTPYREVDVSQMPLPFERVA